MRVWCSECGMSCAASAASSDTPALARRAPMSGFSPRCARLTESAATPDAGGCTLPLTLPLLRDPARTALSGLRTALRHSASLLGSTQDGFNACHPLSHSIAFKGCPSSQQSITCRMNLGKVCDGIYTCQRPSPVATRLSLQQINTHSAPRHGATTSPRGCRLTGSCTY